MWSAGAKIILMALRMRTRQKHAPGSRSYGEVRKAASATLFSCWVIFVFKTWDAICSSKYFKSLTFLPLFSFLHIMVKDV